MQTVLIAIAGLVIVLFIGVSFSGCIGAGSISSVLEPEQGSSIPRVEGINLLGDRVTLPDDLEGERILIAYAFIQQHQAIVNTWIDRVAMLREQFPEMRFYEVPLLGELNVITRLSANNGMRSGIPDPVKRETTITVYTDKEVFREWAKMPDEDDIYIILYDLNGTELWRTRGRASDALTEDLISVLQSTYETN